MKFELFRDEGSGRISFSGQIETSELERLNLGPLDRMLLASVGSSPADSLLALEMLFRRYGEQKS